MSLVGASHKLVGAPDVFPGPSSVSGPPVAQTTFRLAGDKGPGSKVIIDPSTFSFSDTSL